jgi:D-2-hydroxyacid dehydrogenase (NADP+)
MKHTILVSLPLKPPLVERLRSKLSDVAIHPLAERGALTPQHASGTIYLGQPNADEIGAMPNLRFIQAGFAGIDALPIDVLRNSGIVVASAKGIHNRQMSELFFALLLHCSRNMPAWVDQQRRKEWKTQPARETFFLGGKTLCIAGYGTIGKKIAMIAQTFDMRVVGVRSRVPPDERRSDPFTDEVAAVEELNCILPESDVVLNLLPRTPQTENFFDGERFSKMKEGTVFINLGRGATVVDESMLEALDSGRVRIAALDVFREEPLPGEHPFWTHPRIVITPHVGGQMPGYWSAVVDLFIENVNRFRRGERLLNEVDLEKGY